MLEDGGMSVISRKRKLAARLCTLLVFLLEMTAGAATYRRISFDTLVRSSDCIIYGRVIDSRAYWDPATSTIWTRTEILVLDEPKGQAGSTIAITEPGGVVKERGELYPGTPQFQSEQELVLFLYRAPGNRMRVTGSLQGVYAVVIDRQSGDRLVQPAGPQPDTIYEEGSPSAQAAKKLAAGPETLSRFLLAIRQKAVTR
jgi:hypothetical protein